MDGAQDTPMPGGPSFATVDRGVPAFVQVATQVIAKIRAGELPVGEKLPTEKALADQFGVGRSSIREALSCLQFTGYVESQRGSGTVVRSAVARGDELLTDQGLARPADLFDVLEARLVIEPQAVAHAAADPDRERLGELAVLLDGMRLSIGTPGLHARTDLGLHRALIRCCRNPELVTTADRLLVRSEGTLWRTVRDHAWAGAELPRSWVDHHDAVVRAVTTGDPDAAETAMRRHLESVVRNAAAAAGPDVGGTAARVLRRLDATATA